MIFDSKMPLLGLVFSLLLLITACEKAPTAPISEENLIPILLDVHTAEAVLEGENQEMRDSMARKVYYPQIMQKHGTTQADFDSSMSIYSRNPVRLDTLYNKVLGRINALKDTLHKQ